MSGNPFNTSPYTQGRYGPMLSATRGFLDSYQKSMEMRSMMQYRQSLMDLHGEQKEYYRARSEGYGTGRDLDSVMKREKIEAIERLGQEGYEPTQKDVALFPSIKPTQERTPFTPGKVQTVLGGLTTGAPTSLYGFPMPVLRTESQHIKYTTQQLGPHWQELAPEAVNIIKEKFPEGTLTKKTPEENYRAQFPKKKEVPFETQPKTINELQQMMRKNPRRSQEIYNKYINAVQ